MKTESQLTGFRRAAVLAADALQVACEAAKEGVTTDEVDRVTAEYIISRGAYPVGINYYGFPRGLCASVNEVALHGIPNTRPLQNGDIANFDVTVFLNEFYGDNSAMVCIGDVDEQALHIVKTTEECLNACIAEVGPGVNLSYLGQFIYDFAKARGVGVVAAYCGHFIGSELHMKPNVLHVPNDTHLVLQPGMTFTIEPCLIEGGSGEIDGPRPEDGWTILSKYGHWSAQYEHTVLVTEHGVEILTLPER